MRSFDSLSEQEILALAIFQEETDARIYGNFAEGLKATYPATAALFVKMREEEDNHRRRLLDMHIQRFGEHIPLVRREDVKGFARRRPVWLIRPLGPEVARKQAAVMEVETQRFYEKAASRSTDASVRKLLGDLAEEERSHATMAEDLEGKITPNVRQDEEKARRKLFLLQVVQPGLAGLMDGSVSTLAPLFAAAFAFKASGPTFRVGLAAAVGAGISMAFAEGLSDDGSLTGRGRPLLRGITCGLMTTCGGIGHTLPYLLPNYKTATIVAGCVVAVELGVIAWIRKRYMDTPFLSAAMQVIVGGILVFLAGVLIGVG